MGSLPPSIAREFEAAIMVPPGAGSNTWLVGQTAHPKIERRALVGTAKATARAKTKDPKMRKVKNINPSFLPGKVCLDNADLFIHGWWAKRPIPRLKGEPWLAQQKQQQE